MTENFSTNQPLNQEPTNLIINQTPEKKKSFKKIFISSSFFVIIFVLAIVGYSFINQQAKQELSQLNKETKTTADLNNSASNQLQKKSDSYLKERKIVNLPSEPKAEKKSSLYFQTDKKTYQQGEAFNLVVYVQAKGEVVDGVEFVLNYDPKLVKVGQLKTGSFFSLYPQKKVDSQKGQVRLIALQKPNENKKLNQEIVISLTVTALQKGTVKFNFIKNRSHIAAYGGQDLLEEAKPLSITIN